MFLENTYNIKIYVNVVIVIYLLFTFTSKFGWNNFFQSNFPFPTTTTLFNWIIIKKGSKKNVLKVNIVIAQQVLTAKLYFDWKWCGKCAYGIACYFMLFIYAKSHVWTFVKEILNGNWQ